MDSTPSKRRKTSATTSVPVNASQASLSAPRPSYMSPTKSSLSRFNPNVLSRALETLPRRESEGRRSSSPLKLNPTPLRRGQTTRLSASPTHAPSSSPSRQLRVEAGLSAPPRRVSRTPSKIPQLNAPIPVRNAPIADGDEDDERSRVQEELLAQVVRRSARRTRGNRLSWVRAEEKQAPEKEPDLPPTPEQLGLEERPEKPRGLLSSSPTKLTEKKRKHGFNSSPLKPREVRQSNVSANEIRVVEETAERGAGQTKEELEEDPELLVRRAILRQLSAQLESLQRDVSALETEVRRSQNPSQSGSASDIYPDKLISLITSSNPSNAPLPPPPKLPPLTTRLAAFLPFSKRRKPPPKISQQEDAPPILSHYPLPLSNPLPHLRVFTPFTITSSDTLNLPPTDRPDDPLLLQRDTTLSAPKSILTIKLRLISNTVSETVESISLQSISPWAQPELGSWIRKIIPSGDINSIGWAASRYLGVSRARNECWASCAKRWPHLLARTSDENKLLGTLLPDGILGSNIDILAYSGRQSLLFSDGKACLLVSWRIDFDWIGDPQNVVGAETSFPKEWRRIDERGSLGKVGEAFGLLAKQCGVEGAVEGILRVVFGEQGRVRG